MKRLTRVLTVVYVLAGIAYIILDEGNFSVPASVIKGILMPLLVTIFIINLKHNLKGITLLILAGLIFSWAGDILIDFSFIPGLAGFLLAQIMYLSAFFLTPGRNVIFHERIYLFVPIFLSGAILMGILKNDLGEMLLPVAIYAAVILTMLAAAFNRIKKVNIQSYYMVLAGAILFVISDSAIAINRFTWDFPFSGPFIMVTYLIAQYLIITGYLKGLELNS